MIDCATVKPGLAKSNSHLYVVSATNPYSPGYDAEPTGDKRIQLKLVRLWCGIEALITMPQHGLVQNRGLPVK